MIDNFLENISVVCELHDNTKNRFYSIVKNLPQALAAFIKECLFVLYNIGMLYRGENSDLVDGIVSLLLAEMVQFDLLEGIQLAIFISFDFKHV